MIRSRIIAVAMWAACSLLGSCQLVGTVVEYTDGLRNSRKYTVVTRGTAQIGGFVGLLAGVPIDVVALPVTYPVYLVEKEVDPDEASFASTALLPSFALMEVCSLLGVPVSLIELAVYRAWIPHDTMTAQERELFEEGLDDTTLPRYPVTPIYPPPTGRR